MVKIRQIFLILAIVSSFSTYLLQHILNLSEIISEGIPVIFFSLFIFLCIYNKTKLNKILVLIIIYILYLFILTCKEIIINNASPLRVIFIYQYFMLFGIISCIDEEKQLINYNLVLVIIIIVSIFVSLIGITQFFDVNSIIPIDINRARGLSRSSLNYSSIIFISLLFSNEIKNLFTKLLIQSILLFGILVSLSRGAIFAAILFLILSNLKLKNILLIVIILNILFIFLLCINQIYQVENIQILKDRVMNGFSIQNDLGNSLRVKSYLRFFDEFNIVGSGIGSTGPGASRFDNFGYGFESFVLAIIMQGGIMALVFFPLLLLWIFKIWNLPIDYKVSVIISIMFVATFQQTFETPAVNVFLGIYLFYIFTKYSSTTRKEI